MAMVNGGAVVLHGDCNALAVLVQMSRRGEVGPEMDPMSSPALVVWNVHSTPTNSIRVLLRSIASG